MRVFARQNVWITIFLAYCLISAVWSDYPLVAFKRWIKLAGQPIMALIIITEANPQQALIDVIKRSATLLFPLSILFIKYYPQYGRGFDGWTGAPTNTGVTTNKNSLGAYCMVVGIILSWEMIRALRKPPGKQRRVEIIYLLGFFVMLLWLLHMANSATSLGCFIFGGFVLWLLGRTWLNRSRIGSYLFVASTAAALLQVTVGLSNFAYGLLGREPTLTGRTQIWQNLLNANNSPILGYGFESFWLGNRRTAFSEGYVFVLNSAHNGYLETYLNLGVVGLIITLVMLLSAFFKGRRELLIDLDFGRFSIAYLLAFIVYNWTEAAFRTHVVPFFLFFAIAVSYRRTERDHTTSFDSNEKDTAYSFAP